MEMSTLDKDEINDEIRQIENRLGQIRDEIQILQAEKESLLSRKKECLKLIKDIEPSSSGGNRHDISSDWNRTDFKWSAQVEKCLRETFKMTSFRALQLETINVTLSQLDCIVVMPTGGGKSLCFHLPAVVDPGLTLVVSPLVSLVEDQLWYLKSVGIHADTLNASSSKDDVKRIHSDMCDLQSSLKLLYVTPEKLAKSKMFMNKLQKAYEMKRFTRLVIDEVHCCSTYGHDFRPDYKFLGVIKQVFPNVCVLGLTATATQGVIDDIKKILNLSKCVLFKAPFNRPNIFYEVRHKPTNHEECMDEIANLIKSKFPSQSGIVYCFSQRESEQVAQELSSRGIRADCYHAQMDSNQRTRVHENWLKNKVNVIVATIAFGMGIDKSNCRFVIHHSMSKSLENFYQESGRAGRDGLNAWSILYYRFMDVFRQSSMVFTEQTGLVNLYSMVNYCIDAKTCKRNLIAQHFNDDLWDKSGKCNGMCAICLNKSSSDGGEVVLNCLNEAKLVCDVIERNGEKDKKETRVTANKLVELVMSEMNSKKAAKLGYNSLSKLELENLVLTMLMKKYLKEDFHFTPYNTICYVVNGPKSGRLDLESEFLMSFKRSSSKSTNQHHFTKSSSQSKPSVVEKKESVKYEYVDDDDDDCELVFDQNDDNVPPKMSRRLSIEECEQDVKKFKSN